MILQASDKRFLKTESFIRTLFWPSSISESWCSHLSLRGRDWCGDLSWVWWLENPRKLIGQLYFAFSGYLLSLILIYRLNVITFIGRSTWVLVRQSPKRHLTRTNYSVRKSIQGFKCLLGVQSDAHPYAYCRVLPVCRGAAQFITYVDIDGFVFLKSSERIPARPLHNFG